MEPFDSILEMFLDDLAISWNNLTLIIITNTITTTTIITIIITSSPSTSQ